MERATTSSAPIAASRSVVPSPGKIFDPVARGLEVIGDRWTLVLVRQLLGGGKGFQELRQRTGIAPRVLSSRLRQLTGGGFIESREVGSRSLYVVTESGRSLEPIISSVARWWVHRAIDDLEINLDRFTETSPQSIVESLPVLLKEEVARDAHVIFEIRLEGDGGGVWTVEIDAGRCEVRPTFAEGADVRYTADARLWCALALGQADARDAVKRGALIKEGGPQAIDQFFHMIPRVTSAGDADASRGSALEKE